MHWILVLYFSTYGTGAQPHYMGDFASKKGCESMLSQLQADYEINKWTHRDFDGKCYYVEN